MDFSNLDPALVLLTVVSLSLAPFVAVMVTSFTKIVVVLSLLRNALGLQAVPPNVVINGLSIILSIYVMYPIGIQISDTVSKSQGSSMRSAQPLDMRAILDLADKSKEPMREFLIRHTSDGERAFFLKTAQRLLPEDKRESLNGRDFIVVVPAFTVSELTQAFQIGFLIFLPFLIIDLIVSNVLLAMGMMMLAPTTVSLPFKLLLFVLIDGWSRLVHGLVLTYR
ncbi:MAG: type III secretion system export apparatus subunit SctR [Luteimonas sp.]